MAVRLDIEVKHSGGASGSGGFSAADAAAIQRSLEQANRLQVGLQRGAVEFRKEFKAATDALGAGLVAQTQNADRAAARLGLSFQRALETAGKQGGEKLGVEAGKAAERGFRANFKPLGAGLAGASSQALQGFSRFGAEASSAFGVAFSGNLLSGNLLRGVGGLGGSVARLGGELGRSLSTAVGGAFSLIPAVGPALAGVSKVIGTAFSVAGSLAGVLANAAGEIAGYFGDQLATALKITVGAAAVAGVASLRLALKAEQLEPAFAKIAKSSGDSVPAALQKLRTATQGTISDLDLMRSANEAVALKAADNVEQFGRLADVAIKLGRNVGRGPSDAINDLVVGLGRASPRILDNIGLQIQLEDVYTKGAAALGKNAEALTDAEKRTALLNAVLEQAREKLAGQGDTAGTTAVSLARLGASVENAGESIGRALLPAVERLAGPLSNIVDSIARFADRESTGVGATLAKQLGDVEGRAKGLQTVIDGLTWETALALGRNAFQTLWEYAKAGASDLASFLELKLLGALSRAGASLLENPPIDFGGRIGETAKAARAAATTAESAAAGLSFLPRGAAAGRIAGLGAERESIIGRAAARGLAPAAPSVDEFLGIGAGAASRPSSRPAVARQDQEQPRAPLTSDVAFATGPAPGSFAPLPRTVSTLAAAVGPDTASALGPILSTVASAILAAKDPAKELADAVAAFRAADIRGSVDALGETITADLRRSVENFDENIRDVERQEDLLGRKIQDAAEAGKRLGEELARGLDEIGRTFARDQQAILANRDAQIGAARQRTAGVASGLLADAGGIGPDASAIPPKLRRAAAKARKQANRERRESLRSLSDGLSVDELAANGAEQLQAVFQEQGARETGEAAAIQQAYAAAADALKQLGADRLVAEQEFRAAIEADAKLNEENMRKSIEILEGLAKSKAADEATKKEFAARLAAIEKQIKAAESVAARAAR